MKNPIFFIIMLSTVSFCGCIASDSIDNKFDVETGQIKTNSPPEGKIRKLKDRAYVVDRMFAISARMHVDVYFQLADVYLKKGRKDEAKDPLKKALLLKPSEFSYQLIMAELEIGDREYESAGNRLDIIYNNCTDEMIIMQALDLSQQFNLVEHLKK